MSSAHCSRALAGLFPCSLLLLLTGATAATPGGKALALGEALSRTLERSPVLASFPYRERIAEARVLQAGLRPNPELDAELENFAGSGPYQGTNAASLTLALSQLIEMGDKRERRAALAEIQRDLLGTDYAIARLDVLAEAARRFVRVARDQALLEVALQEQAMTERAVELAEQRAESGRSSSVEVSQARIAEANARMQQEHAEHELLASRVHLAASWGELEPDFGSVDAPLFSLPSTPPYETLRAGLEVAPALERYLTLDRVHAARLRLAEARARQDARVGVGVRRFEDTGDTALLLRFSIALPVSDRNQGAIAAARQERRLSEAERRQVRIDIHAALFSLYQELAHARTELAMLEKTVLPEASQALQVIEAGYQTGRFSYLELIEARRQHLQAKRSAIEAAARFHILLLELERLTGQPFVITQRMPAGE